MANARAGSVIRVDTDGYPIPAGVLITAIRYVGASTGAANITEADSGMKVWEDNGASNSHSADIDMRLPKGGTVNITAGTPVIYIYLE